MKVFSNRTRGLWCNPDFMKLWIGESISLHGSAVTTFALPLVAVLTLHAAPYQMGILLASQFAPYLLITLFAGVWIDKSRRRPIMITANAGRACLLGLIPILYTLGYLHIALLYLIVFFTSVLTVIFELSYQSYLPTLITHEHLVDGNSKLQLSASVAQISGPSIGGILVQLLTAPFVIILDAVSYIISAVALTMIRTLERNDMRTIRNRSIWFDIKSGIQCVFSNRYLRAIAFEAATFNFFSLMNASVVLLYFTRDLHINPGLLGLIMGAASIGSLIGSITTGHLGRRFGTGITIFASMFLACAAPLIIPIAVGPIYVMTPMLVLSYFLSGVGLVISNIHVTSLRQAMIPKNLLGRVNASYRFICSCATPIGAILGGKLGEMIGLRETLMLGSTGLLMALCWILFSPVVKLQQIPEATFDIME